MVVHLNTSYFIFSFLFGLCILDHGHTESKLNKPTELVQAEEVTNTELVEGKLRCIPPIIFNFCFNHCFMLSMFVY
jgi:hypothetical protein